MSLFQKSKSDSVIDEKRFDPVKLADPVALKTSFEPLVYGGTNYVTHKLVCESGKFYFVQSAASRLGAFFLIIIGLLLPAFLIYGFWQTNQTFHWKMVIPLVLMVVFPSAGICLLMRHSGFRIFDFECKSYYFSPKKEAYDDTCRKDKISFSDIHALQLVAETCRRTGKGGGYYESFELNIVKHDGSRVNVIDHGDLETVLQDGQILAEKLNVPLWNAAC